MRIDAHMRMRFGRQNLYAHSRQKKTRSKIEQNWGAVARAQKRLKFLTKIVKNLSKIGQKMGPKWWFFLLMWCGKAHIRASMRYDSASPKTSTWPTLVNMLEIRLEKYGLQLRQKYCWKSDSVNVARWEEKGGEMGGWELEGRSGQTKFRKLFQNGRS